MYRLNNDDKSAGTFTGKGCWNFIVHNKIVMRSVRSTIWKEKGKVIVKYPNFCITPLWVALTLIIVSSSHIRQPGLGQFLAVSCVRHVLGLTLGTIFCALGNYSLHDVAAWVKCWRILTYNANVSQDLFLRVHLYTPTLLIRSEEAM